MEAVTSGPSPVFLGAKRGPWREPLGQTVTTHCHNRSCSYNESLALAAATTPEVQSGDEISTEMLGEGGYGQCLDALGLHESRDLCLCRHRCLSAGPGDGQGGNGAGVLDSELELSAIAQFQRSLPLAKGSR